MRVIVPFLFLHATVSVRNDENVMKDLEKTTYTDMTVAEQDEQIKVYETAVEAGAAIVKTMICDDLESHMLREVTRAEEALSNLLTDPEAESPVVQSSETIMAFVTEADKRKCLPKVMMKSETQDMIKTLLDNHLSATLMADQLGEAWCHNGIADRRHSLGQLEELACCDVGCGVCLRYGKESKTDDNRTCGELPGGESLCCSENFTSCSDRDQVACMTTRETNPARLLEQAYALLLAWQQGTYDLAGPDLERSLLFPEDMDEEENCPTPCGKCTREHNSWRKGEELFKFKCLLQRGEAVPSDPRLRCSAPRRRRSFWRPHRWGRKTWCEVEGWKTAVCNQLRVSATMHCGIRLIMSPLEEDDGYYSGFANRVTMYERCLRTESEMKSFDDYGLGTGLRKLDQHVPRRNLISFTLILSLGLANGLAAVRDGSLLDPSGIAQSVLLQPFLQGRDVDSSQQQLFNGTAVDQPPRPCDPDELDQCRPAWKIRNANFLTQAWATISVAILVGFWTLFWGSLAFFSTSMFYAAIGWAYSPLAALGGSLVGKVYLSAVTAVGAAFGFLTTPVHCYLFNGFTPWLCHQNLPCPNVKVAPSGHESWTELLENAMEEAKLGREDD